MTNTSVNPARSTGPAIFVGGWAPLIGAVAAGLFYRAVWAVPPKSA